MPRFVPTPVDDPVAAELLDEYFASRELVFTGGVYRRTDPDPATFTPPVGIFVLVLADEDDAVAGCGGMRLLTPDRGEIKHLWLRGAFRGHGWGRELLRELEARAFSLGAREVVLDTNASLEAAQSLYRSSGYVEIEPYNDNPNATHWFAKQVPTGRER